MEPSSSFSPAAGFRECVLCEGSGEVWELLDPPDPQSVVEGVCPRCDGEGVVPT